MKRSTRLALFLASTFFLVAATAWCAETSDAGASQSPPVAAEPFTPQGDAEAARVQALAWHVVEVQVRVPLVGPDPRTGRPAKGHGQAFGTGWVAAVRRGSDGSWHSLVVTNQHVCAMNPATDQQDNPRPGVSVTGPAEYKVHIADGTKLAVAPIPVLLDEASDICILDVSGTAGTPVELADTDPPFGAVVERWGDDQAIYERALMVYASGRWSGVKDFAEEHSRSVVSLPASHGASGSPIFYHGRVVSMLVATSFQDVSHFAFCVTLEDLRTVLATARAAWK